MTMYPLVTSATVKKEYKDNIIVDMKKIGRKGSRRGLKKSRGGRG